MNRTIWSLAAVTILAVSGTAEVQAKTLAPVTEWNDQQETDRCRVTRLFGEENNYHLAIFEQFQPGSKVSLTVAGPAMAPFFTRGIAPLAVSNSDTTAQLAALSMAVPRFGAAVLIEDAPLDSFASPETRSGLQPAAREAGEAGILQLARDGKDVRLKTGSLDAVRTMLDSCTQRLAASWGLNLAQLNNAASTPRWANREKLLVHVNDSFGYGWQRRRQPQGLAYLRVIVSETGATESCAVVFVTAERLPNSRACQIMEKARFEPARDSNGRPLRSYHFTAFLDYRHPLDHLRGHPWGDPLFAVR